MAAEVYYSEEIRSIILNAHKIREFNKCPGCEGTGYQNWNNVEGNDLKPGPLSEYHEDREYAECEECDVIGYKDVTMYSEE